LKPSRSSSVEVGLKGRIAELQRLTLARFDEGFASGTPAVAVPAGNRIPGVPRTSLYAELQWRDFGSGFRTALEARRNGAVAVDDQNSDAAASYTVMNLRAGFEQKARGWRVAETLRIDNLADRRYIGHLRVIVLGAIRGSIRNERANERKRFSSSALA